MQETALLLKFCQCPLRVFSFKMGITNCCSKFNENTSHFITTNFLKMCCKTISSVPTSLIQIKSNLFTSVIRLKPLHFSDISDINANLSFDHILFSCWSWSNSWRPGLIILFYILATMRFSRLRILIQGKINSIPFAAFDFNL